MFAMWIRRQNILIISYRTSIAAIEMFVHKDMMPLAPRNAVQAIPWSIPKSLDQLYPPLNSGAPSSLLGYIISRLSVIP